MAGAGIKLTITGFDKLLDDIQSAGGDVVKSTEKALKDSADIVEQELKRACAASGVPASISREIKSTTKWNDNACTAHVGWDMDGYNPRAPSAGYKAAFLNYGTPRRAVKVGKEHVQVGGAWKTLGTDRGEITGKGFISAARESASPKVKKVQKKALEEILKEVGS